MVTIAGDAPHMAAWCSRVRPSSSCHSSAGSCRAQRSFCSQILAPPQVGSKNMAFRTSGAPPLRTRYRTVSSSSGPTARCPASSKLVSE